MSRTGQHSTSTSLAYEMYGDGVPVVFLHGLTFDRTTWRPIIERLGGHVRSIAVDLPGHGDTGGVACTLREAAARVNSLLETIGVDAPVVVGHSMSAGIASIYAAQYPVCGLVNVDGGIDIRPLAEVLQRLESVLRSDPFPAAFEPFQQSMGFDRVPEPDRSRALASQSIRRDVILGYWEELMRSDASELQSAIEAELAAIDAPCLGVFGHRLSSTERRHLREHLPQMQVEAWREGGHLVHLAEPDRFTARLRTFIDQITTAPGTSASTTSSAAPRT